MQNTDKEKKIAAKEAVQLIKDGMIIGIGTGSTVNYFIEELGKKVASGLKVKGVSSSTKSSDLARSYGIEIMDDFEGTMDIDVDGADQVDGNGNLIKGGGGALLREKIVAFNSRRVCIIVDREKMAGDRFGSFPLPVEVTPYFASGTIKHIEKLGSHCKLRQNGNFVTDNGNLIADCEFGKISDPCILEKKIKSIPGVVEVGLFVNMTSEIIVGSENSAKFIKLK
ncbi:ribose-5-phosphate isomerase RpiA [Oxyplasma meridianum]|uniref:Ribose-5-phosphate isomerase A n=1 Tax=Oxyplasma meridianum TaxID=3073602 RepID=A0AAX4NHG2_9ARCH